MHKQARNRKSKAHMASTAAAQHIMYKATFICTLVY